MNTIKRIINWANYNLGGLRDPECFFAGVGDEIDRHIERFGVDEPSLN